MPSMTSMALVMLPILSSNGTEMFSSIITASWVSIKPYSFKRGCSLSRVLFTASKPTDSTGISSLNLPSFFRLPMKKYILLYILEGLRSGTSTRMVLEDSGTSTILSPGMKSLAASRTVFSSRLFTLGSVHLTTVRKLTVDDDWNVNVDETVRPQFNNSQSLDERIGASLGILRGNRAQSW